MRLCALLTLEEREGAGMASTAMLDSKAPPVALAGSTAAVEGASSGLTNGVAAWALPAVLALLDVLVEVVDWEVGGARAALSRDTKSPAEHVKTSRASCFRSRSDWP